MDREDDKVDMGKMALYDDNMVHSGDVNPIDP